MLRQNMFEKSKTKYICVSFFYNLIVNAYVSACAFMTVVAVWELESVLGRIVAHMLSTFFFLDLENSSSTFYKLLTYARQCSLYVCEQCS